MKRNVGNVDAAVRILLGLVICSLGFYFQTWWGAIGLIPLLTGIIGYCPLYRLTGINTCKQ